MHNREQVGSGANSLLDRIPLTAHEVVQIREQEQRHEHEQGHGEEQVDILGR